jgi:hypothetical protein
MQLGAVRRDVLGTKRLWEGELNLSAVALHGE